MLGLDRLSIAIVGEDRERHMLWAAIKESLAGASADSADSALIDVIGRSGVVDESMAGDHHLVIGTIEPGSPWIDVVVRSPGEADQLVVDRLLPWVTKWSIGRRAPRAQVAELSEADPGWPDSAARLIARIRNATAATDVRRVDHIGSTSVGGLAAKDLIDIQVTTGPQADPTGIAAAVTRAGFVHVVGQLYGKDRLGDLHPEQVCVDADPGRPVNINIRAADNPVAREVLLYRDWLRADSSGRGDYETMKRGLVGRHVDDYGDRKEPFISAALQRAERWAAETGWRFS